MPDIELVRELAKFDLFRNLSVEQITMVAESIIVEDVLAGEEILREGKHGLMLFLIATGAVDVEKDTDKGQIVLNRLFPGEFFGEMAILTSSSRSATIRAAEDTVLFAIPEGELKKMMKRYPTVATDLDAVMKERMEDTERKLQRTQNLVAVYSTSDRVGKTSLLCNLGVYLKSVLFLDTTLIDANLQFGDLGYIFHLPVEKHLATLAESRAPVNNDTLGECIATHESGLKILPAPLEWENVELVDPDLLEEVVHWLQRENDFVLVECAPKIDDVTLRVLDIADKILVLVTPDYISVKNTRRVLSLFRDKLDYPPEKVVIGLNHIFPEHFRPAAVKKLLGIDNFDFELPNEPGKFIGLFKDGDFEVLKNDQGDVAKSISRIAKDVLLAQSKDKGAQTEKTSLLGKLFQKK